ncbi:MAG: glycosyltransferase family 2 protein, partial [Nitrospinaceae bacterium]|nr:glycosyltransferase family 2 protein [Nitrospinaceae bacterium]
MDVSIVLVNYFSSGPLRECLNSLPEAVRDLECETIVVDNSPEDPALAALAGRVPGLRILSNPVNRGFARACNQGAAEARGTALLFLNPDTILADQSVKRMWNYLQAHPDAGALGPRVLNPDGSLQHSCRRFPTLGAGLFNRYSLLSRVFPRNPVTARYLMTDFDHKTTRDVDWVSGCCLMVSRKAFETAGGFDERFFLFNEDVDLCRTLNHRGFRVVYF